jgi:multidrug efflux pump subunit AcrB
MHRSTDNKLLRQYVRKVLTEDFGGYGGDYAGIGLDVDSGPYGRSYGSNQDLYDAFIGPWVDVFKTAVGKSKEVTRTAWTAVDVVIGAALTSIIPGLGRTYENAFEEEKKDLEKIKSKYKDVYDKTDQALASTDAAFVAFMSSPALVIGKIAAEKSPTVAKEILSVATGGSSDEFIDRIRSKNAEASDDKKKSKKDPKDFFGESQLNEEEKESQDSLERKILTNKKFLQKVTDAPTFKEMQQVAVELYRDTLKDIYGQAEAIVKKAKTIEDLQKLTKKPIPDADKIKKLPPAEKAKAEKLLLDGVRKAMKDYYVKSLEQQVASVTKAGIPEDAQYIKDFRSTIQKIKSL